MFVLKIAVSAAGADTHHYIVSFMRSFHLRLPPVLGSIRYTTGIQSRSW